jgi:pimeloyl-ACP methyl ester carboxylesterase
MSVSPFSIAVAPDVLSDLHDRLSRTRWPDAVSGAGWDYGTDTDYLRTLTDYWRDGFDWRAVESELNTREHLMVDVGELPVHVLRQRANGSDAAVVLLLHGWPDSFYRFWKILPLLDQFELVVPSLPGYGFSARPEARGFSAERMADHLATVMQELGYDRYLVHGGDVGSSVGESLAARHPDAVRGLHLTDVPYWHLFAVDPSSLSEAEQAYHQAGQAWQMREGAYALMQSTRPQTAAVGLNDSPAGLASWIVEKFRAWSDCDGDVERRLTRDELLTNLTIYWATQTIGSSFRVYYERDLTRDGSGRLDVPTAVAIFPKDIVPAPREFAERFFRLERWTEMPRGGHFAALEEPELLADDIVAFVAATDP